MWSIVAALGQVCVKVSHLNAVLKGGIHSALSGRGVSSLAILLDLGMCNCQAVGFSLKPQMHFLLFYWLSLWSFQVVCSGSSKVETFLEARGGPFMKSLGRNMRLDSHV